MKLREKIKRFFRLDVHNHEGFTLVELIIVIAILAILSSVAVVGYSSYVTKANIQADKTLAAEVESALMLAYYSGQLEGPATIVIYFDENKPSEGSNDAAEAAMKAAFGDNWEDLRLSYSGWAEEIGVVADQTMVNYINGSTFNADEENLGALLNDVENVVGVLVGAIEGGTINITTGSALDKFLKANGIVNEDSNAQAISNATVMYVAGNMDSALKTTVQKDAFAKTWATVAYAVPNFSNSFGGDEFASLSSAYAFVEALAKYIDNQPGSSGDNVAYLTETSKAATNRSQMESILTNTYDHIIGNPLNVSAFCNYFGINPTTEEQQADLTTTPAYTDAMAFIGYMQGISSSSDSLLSGTDLTNKNYYTDGQVLNYVTNYVSIGQAMLDMGVDSSKGAFVIHFDGESVLCMPLDY